jgi:hypothetical protein
MLSGKILDDKTLSKVNACRQKNYLVGLNFCIEALGRFINKNPPKGRLLAN